MTLYFEYPIKFKENGVISTYGSWHPIYPLLAVASYSQERGGFVTIIDELGEPISNVIFPVHPVSQVTSLVWHPEKKILVTGWENGEIKIWKETNKEFQDVQGLHQSPITFLKFSDKGGRLVSCDATGSLMGWKIDSNGETATVFHNELKESITNLIFRGTKKNCPDFDVEGLAKAAVNGDENALDIFSNWRPKTTAKKFSVQDGVDNYCFFVTTQSGSICYINASGECREVFNTGGLWISYLLYHPSKDIIVFMVEGFTICQFSVNSNGKLTEITKIKLSGRFNSVRGVGDQGLIFAGSTCLAILTGEMNIRIWDIDANDNYLLPTKTTNTSTKEEHPQEIRETFTCLSYCKINQTICAGTNIGKIYFWSKTKRYNEQNETSDNVWELTHVSYITGTIKQLAWGSINLSVPLLTVNCVTKVYVMKEQTLCACFCKSVWATQLTASQVLLENEECKLPVQTDLQVTGMCLNDEYLVVTNGHVISVYQLSVKNAITSSFINSFRCSNEDIQIYSKNIIILTDSSVKIFTVHGLTVSTTFEGEPIGINVLKNFLTVFSIDGVLRVYDLSSKESKMIGPPCNLFDVCDDFGEIVLAKSNCVGSKVALILASSNLIPDGNLYVWDFEQLKLFKFDYRNCDKLKSSEGDQSGDKIWSQRVPLSLDWDEDDERLLVCNSRKLSNEKKKYFSLYKNTECNDNKIDIENNDQLLMTFFVSSEHGIQIHDVRATDSDSRLLGVSTPYIAVLENLIITRKVMTDFIGLENCSNETKQVILNFSFNLSHGNMDAAFKSIKLIQNQSVWNSLAKMCVKTKRLDVATVCLGHMGDARAVNAFKIAMDKESLPLEAKVAVLAQELGMLEEAENLYKECNRYDLLNRFYQQQNKWSEALEIARTKDRIHYKNTEHRYAKYLEFLGNIKEAIQHYEKANTHRSEVPRILLDSPKELEAYIVKSNDKELLKWWGQYLESQGDIKAAMKYYVKAEDVYNQVRALCLMEEEEKAAQLARSGSDKAAFYHMARYYETHNNIKKAITFYTKATAFSNAVRLCKEINDLEELWNISLISSNRDKINCARFFNENGKPEKAVILYHRAGVLHKALDLAFKSHQFDIIQSIASDLDTESDPALIDKCAKYFVENEQYDKAVDLLAIGKKFEEAIRICIEYNVQLTEDLAEKLTPEKGDLDENIRVQILETLAESLEMQGSYHLATKKFTQAGNRFQAMKALLKSGDTEKIIFFATVSRQKEVYIMAANYLQSLDWQNNPEILKNIITFYSKGKALDMLANFYVACAQVEIDEFQNYEKAFGALAEASRCLSKTVTSKNPIKHKRAMEIVQKRMTDTKRFLDIKKMFENGDFQQGMTQCRQLLTSREADLEESVRKGDIYALMMQYNIKNGNFIEAQELLNELQHILKMSNTLPITYYVNKEMIEALARGLSVSPSSLLPNFTKKIHKEPSEQDLEVYEEVED